MKSSIEVLEALKTQDTSPEDLEFIYRQYPEDELLSQEIFKHPDLPAPLFNEIVSNALLDKKYQLENSNTTLMVYNQNIAELDEQNVLIFHRDLNQSNWEYIHKKLFPYSGYPKLVKGTYNIATGIIKLHDDKLNAEDLVFSEIENELEIKALREMAVNEDFECEASLVKDNNYILKVILQKDPELLRNLITSNPLAHKRSSGKLESTALAILMMGSLFMGNTAHSQSLHDRDGGTLEIVSLDQRATLKMHNLTSVTSGVQESDSVLAQEFKVIKQAFDSLRIKDGSQPNEELKNLFNQEKDLEKEVGSLLGDSNIWQKENKSHPQDLLSHVKADQLPDLQVKLLKLQQVKETRLSQTENKFDKAHQELKSFEQKNPNFKAQGQTDLKEAVHFQETAKASDGYGYFNIHERDNLSYVAALLSQLH